DTEHIAIGRETLSWMCLSYKAIGIYPLVRIPSINPDMASEALDGGAEGIVVPYVENVQQVKKMVGAVKLKPLKGKRLHNHLFEGEPIEPALAGYLDNCNQNKTLVVNIESVPAMEKLKEIVKVKGLDGILIGPHDLSCSMGIPEDYNHPEFVKAVDYILETGRKAGIGAGIHVTYSYGMEQQIRWIKQGANLIVHSADVLAMKNQLSADIATLREASGDGVEKNANEMNI
ncbi:MAG: HpcH/HpaI aldolase family protein, partial [Mariniphaga sp.]